MTSRWNPLQDILNIQERMSRIFQGNDLSHGGEWNPAVDIYETEQGIVILAELPGTPEDNIDVQISEGILTLRGVKPSPVEHGSDTFYRLERTSGKFSRSFALPTGIDTGTVKASIKDGILKITFDKSQMVTPRSVKVVKSEEID